MTNLELLATFVYEPEKFPSALEEWANDQDRRAAEEYEQLLCKV